MDQYKLIWTESKSGDNWGKENERVEYYSKIMIKLFKFLNTNLSWCILLFHMIHATWKLYVGGIISSQIGRIS